MTPKRKDVSVKKVVRETAQVAVVETSNDGQKRAELEYVTASTTTAALDQEEEHLVRTIPVEGEIKGASNEAQKERTEQFDRETTPKQVGEEEPKETTTSAGTTTTADHDDQEKEKERNTTAPKYELAVEEEETDDREDGEAKEEEEDEKLEAAAKAKAKMNASPKKRKRRSKSRLDQA